jgi:preprotein translocase subunit SecY
MIGQIFQGSFYAFWQKWFGQGAVGYYVLYSLLILGFAYFYTTISFNTVEIARNLQKNGGFIPGIRAGKPTSDYLDRISKRLTLFGALFLMMVATLPAIALALFDITVLMAFGPTSVLIMCSVALETTSQLESLMLMRHYKGFLG